MIRSILALAISAIVVAGCATPGPSGNEVLNASMNPKIARVVIYVKALEGTPDWIKRSKPPDWLGALEPEFVVDGKSVGQRRLGFVSCDLQPGRHIIAVKSDIAPSVGSESSVDLRAGTVTYFNAAVQGLLVTQYTLTNVTDIQGRADVGDLHQISADCPQANDLGH